MENIKFDTKDTVEIDSIKLHKMVFIYNALENGWTLNKKKNLYIFNKKHEGKKEVLLDDYLRRFMVKNFDSGDL
jgi:hypothetical protein